MKNIPFFTTPLGVASLTLEEIAYRQEAFIIVHDTADTKAFIDECAGFCRAVGASEIYLCGCLSDNDYPLYARIISMVCDVRSDWNTDCMLVSVTEQTVDTWRCIYNEKMKHVPCSRTLTIMDASKLVSEGTGYFVYRGSKLLGIGKVSGAKLEAVASCVSGAGKLVFKTLMRAVSGNRVFVEVAEQNIPAMRMYRELGFCTAGEVAKWYCYKK